MTPEEARERVAAQDTRLRALEAEVTRLAAKHATPVLLAMLRGLVEMVCATHGENFIKFYKTQFYEGVLLMLREKGIS